MFVNVFVDNQLVVNNDLGLMGLHSRLGLYYRV